MPASVELRSLLQQGDRRTVGHVSEAVGRVLREPELLPALVECLFAADRGTRMRAADALEKLSRQRIEGLRPYVPVLLNLFEVNEEQELRWHLAVTLPRLPLEDGERRRAVQVLQRCLTAKSSIVRTFALQGLFDLIAQEPTLTPWVTDLLRSAERDGSPAMKARSRRLLARLENCASKPGSSDNPRESVRLL